MSLTAEQAAPTENKYNHKYDGQLKTVSGYAVCSSCGCHENSDESIIKCSNYLNLDKVVIPTSTSRVLKAREKAAKLGRKRKEYLVSDSEHAKIKALLSTLREVK